METAQTIEIDIIGQICPSSLLIALREINGSIPDLKSGRLNILVKTDNRDCTNTIPEAAVNMGLKAEVIKSEGCYSILITRAQPL